MFIQDETRSSLAKLEPQEFLDSILCGGEGGSILGTSHTLFPVLYLDAKEEIVSNQLMAREIYADNIQNRQHRPYERNEDILVRFRIFSRSLCRCTFRFQKVLACDILGHLDLGVHLLISFTQLMVNPSD